MNLPQRLKQSPARSLKVDAEAVPVIEGEGYRVRVVLGQSGAAEGATGTPEEMTLLDGFVHDGRFIHSLPEGRQAWIYAVSGAVEVRSADEVLTIEAGTATTVAAGPAVAIALAAEASAHFVLLAGRPIHEAFVKHGPLVMSTDADVRRTLANYAEGKFGRIPA